MSYRVIKEGCGVERVEVVVIQRKSMLAWALGRVQ